MFRLTTPVARHKAKNGFLHADRQRLVHLVRHPPVEKPAETSSRNCCARGPYRTPCSTTRPTAIMRKHSLSAPPDRQPGGSNRRHPSPIRKRGWRTFERLGFTRAWTSHLSPLTALRGIGSLRDPIPCGSPPRVPYGAVFSRTSSSATAVVLKRWTPASSTWGSMRCAGCMRNGWCTSSKRSPTSTVPRRQKFRRPDLGLSTPV